MLNFVVNNLNSFEEVLLYAIKKEQEAHEMYYDCSKIVKSRSSRSLLEQLSRDELRHKAILQNILDNSEKVSISSFRKLPSIQVSDQMIQDESDIKSVLTFAINEEAKALKMYSELAETSDNEEIKLLLLNLAYEENKHRISLLYELETNFSA